MSLQQKCHESIIKRSPDYYIGSDGLPNILNENNKKTHQFKYKKILPKNCPNLTTSKKLLKKRPAWGEDRIISIYHNNDTANAIDGNNSKLNETFGGNEFIQNNSNTKSKIIITEVNDKQSKDKINQKIKNMFDFSCDLDDS